MIAGTAVLSDLRDHAVRLMKRHERHGLRPEVATAKAKAANAINLIISFSLVNFTLHG